MALFDEMVNTVKNASGFQESKNYYFEKHKCAVTGEEMKIYMETMLIKENFREGGFDVVRLGVCPDCQKVFYHKDYKKHVYFR